MGYICGQGFKGFTKSYPFIAAASLLQEVCW
ncbi:UNVERIFIED_CONTAM: hypothetical protein GTU68_038700 [Idotea baltica]|nr:hypothetical protein [Idotea baltica]